MSFAARRMGGIPSSTLVISANTSNLVITPLQIPNYTVGMRVEIMVSAGVYLYSTNSTFGGLNIIDFNSSDVITITNLGFIVGAGGAGGSVYGSSFSSFKNGRNGGPALWTVNPITVNNTSGFIGGGGGGGGAGVPLTGTGYVGSAGGGGAGGGSSGSVSIDSYFLPAIGSPTPGTASYEGSIYTSPASGVAISTGGSGGFSIPGSGYNGGVIIYSSSGTSALGGTLGPIAGAGGASFVSTMGVFAGAGGGGGWGAAGGAGVGVETPGTYIQSGSGGFANNIGLSANSDGTVITSSLGGLGGKAVELNAGAGSITWVGGAASSSRAYGTVS